MSNQDIELSDKWRLILGRRVEEDLPLNKKQGIFGLGLGSGAGMNQGQGQGALARFSLGDLDYSLSYIYDDGLERGPKDSGSKDKPQLHALKWLNTTKQLFPSDVYEIIQRDALSKGKVAVLLNDDDFVEKLEPNMDLMNSILAIHSSLSDHALENAKRLDRKSVV